MTTALSWSRQSWLSTRATRRGGSSGTEKGFSSASCFAYDSTRGYHNARPYSFFQRCLPGSPTTKARPRCGASGYREFKSNLPKIDEATRLKTLNLRLGSDSAECKGFQPGILYKGTSAVPRGESCAGVSSFLLGS